jgi:hypothetical protein
MQRSVRLLEHKMKKKNIIFLMQRGPSDKYCQFESFNVRTKEDRLMHTVNAL